MQGRNIKTPANPFEVTQASQNKGVQFNVRDVGPSNSSQLVNSSTDFPYQITREYQACKEA
eukprot:scaffold2611_cov43-Cyclotella_meneghiniana.AAC.7